MSAWTCPQRQLPRPATQTLPRQRFAACRDGAWRSAGKIAFGEDWAAWLAAGNAGNHAALETEQRIAAYQDLEAIAPEQLTLLASPAVLLPLLPGIGPPETEEGDEPDEPLDEHQRNRERHAFLLRLGVWEVLPVEAFEDRTTRGREPFPADWSIGDQRQQNIKAAGGWRWAHWLEWPTAPQCLSCRRLPLQVATG